MKLENKGLALPWNASMQPFCSFLLGAALFISAQAWAAEHWSAVISPDNSLEFTFVKDPAAVVKPGQKVHVTVTEIDLPRQRIALSMKSNPQLGPKTARPVGGAVPSPRGGPGPQRGAGTPPPARAPQAVNNDWFSAALNKKK